MVDPVFKAPPPPINPPEMPVPPIPQNQTQAEPVEKSAPVEQMEPVAPVANEQEPFSRKQQAQERLNALKEHMVRYFWYSILGMFLLGAFFGCAMSGPKTVQQKAPAVTGISARVVPNKDKKTRLGICGSVAPSQSCLFYVLNNTSYDKVAEDFFEQVSRAMQRSVFNIRLDNPLYQKQPIKPGYFAEIIVPSS